MSPIPTKITEAAFDCHVRPYLSTAQRAYVSKIPLFKIFNYLLYWLHTGCQWEQLPIAPDTQAPDKKEISHDAVYHHFRKWSRDGSLEKVWQQSVWTVQDDLNLSALNLDGSHTMAKKGGDWVAYQGRKKAKTSNIVSIMEANGYVIASTGIVAEQHHDAFEIKPYVQSAFKTLKRWGLDLRGACFNADSAFDTRAVRKTCFNYGLF